MIVLMASSTGAAIYKNKQISYQKIIPIMFLALFGVFLLVSNNHYDNDSELRSPSLLRFTPGLRPSAKRPIMDIFNSPEGVVMLLLAAFTEASIYFLVKNIKTTNNWNHIFISYVWGAIFMSLYFIPNFSGSEATFKVSSWRLSAPLPNIAKITGAGTLITSPLSASLGLNIVIGLLGYLLRFFAISRLDPLLYASLSYFGIVMAFVYGIFLNGDSIDIKKIAGAVIIIISNLILMRDYVGV
jgi:drug/metabolite transporter (DMT)-like permease